jgi:hypothetical protein
VSSADGSTPAAAVSGSALAGVIATRISSQPPVTSPE